MRIAMVTGSYPPQACGVGDYAARLVEELQSAGMEVEVITTVGEGRPPHGAVQYTLKKWTFARWWKALRWMRSRHYDLMHIQYPARFYGYRPFLAFLSVVARIVLPGTPLVITLHEFRITHVLRKLTVVALTAPASAVITTADSERVALVRWMPWIRSRLHLVTMASTIVPVSQSGAQRVALRRQYGIGENEMVVVFFGLLHPNKGVETVLDSFAAVHDRLPSTKLLMLSLFEPDANPYHAELRSTVAKRSLEHAVIWAGFLANDAVSAHLQCADAGVFPFEDGVSLRRMSFMTAMCHGLPVVTTMGHAGTEAIGLRDGDNVLLVEAGTSAGAIADRLIALATDPDLRARISTGARAWAAPFQWSGVVEKTRAVYTHLAQRG